MGNARPHPPPRSEAHQEMWHVHYGYVHVGTIERSVGNPSAAPQRQLRCGFYPGSRPGECRAVVAPTFDQARADFEASWRVFSARRIEADYHVWRDQRDWTERKYAIVLKNLGTAGALFLYGTHGRAI